MEDAQGSMLKVIEDTLEAGENVRVYFGPFQADVAQATIAVEYPGLLFCTDVAGEIITIRLDAITAAMEMAAPQH